MNQSPGMVGRKVGMTQLFADDGTVIPCTVVECGPNTVMQVKTKSTKDGYDAIQLGFGVKKERLVNKATAGRAKAANAAAPAEIREIRVDGETAAKHTVGQVINAADVFAVGQLVDVVGTSKGRGFAGVFKRYHFQGFERSHGTHEYFRHGGSIGTRLTPGMTLAGKKMPGHLGDHRVTVQNIEVVKVEGERNLVYIRGGVPGPNGGYVTLRRGIKNLK